jgi:hypothetical protein
MQRLMNQQEKLVAIKNLLVLDGRIKLIRPEEKQHWVMTVYRRQSEDRRCGQLFDRCEFLGMQRRRLLDGGWSGVFREYLLSQLPIGDVAFHFDSDFGRTTKDLHIAIGALLRRSMASGNQRRSSFEATIGTWMRANGRRRCSGCW